MKKRYVNILHGENLKFYIMSKYTWALYILEYMNHCTLSLSLSYIIKMLQIHATCMLKCIFATMSCILLSSNRMKQTARQYSPSLLVRARGGDELTVGRFLETLSRGCGCGPSRFGLGLNSVLKSTRSKPSSNSGISSNSSGSTSPSYCSRNTDLGTGTEKESSDSAVV